MAGIEERSALLSLAQLIHGCDGYERITLDRHGRFAIDRSWRTLCPTWSYPLMLSSHDQDVNADVLQKMTKIFGARVVQQVVPAAKKESAYVILTAREVKQLFVDLAMVSETDMRHCHAGKKDGRDFDSLTQEEYDALYEEACPLNLDEIFCFENTEFGAHAWGFGEKPEGRTRLVSACRKIANSYLGREDHFSYVKFYDTFVKRGIGPDTPIGTVYRLPEGLYVVSEHEVLNLGCKLKVLLPLGNDKELPPLVFFMPTQLHALSHRQSLLRHIGADALVAAIPRLEEIFAKLGISPEKKVKLFGYSLGGLQARLFMNWAPELVDSFFASSIPGIEPRWQEMFTFCFPKDIDPIRATYTFNEGDGIRFFGGVQPPDRCEVHRGDGGAWPIHEEVYQMSDARKPRIRKQRVTMGNAFDVLYMTITSFWGAHCRTLALQDVSAVLIDNSERLIGKLHQICNMTMLNIEGVARRALVDLCNMLFQEDSKKKSFQIYYLEKLQKERKSVFDAYIAKVQKEDKDLYEYLASHFDLPSPRRPRAGSAPASPYRRGERGAVLLPV